MADQPYSTSEAVKAVAAMQVVPTERHGAGVEWHGQGWSIEIEFDSQGVPCAVSWERA